MKKVISFLLVLVLTVVSFGFVNEASANAPFDVVVAGLDTNETSAPSSRVVANNFGTWNVLNSGKFPVTFRIFKNGIAVVGYTTVAPGARNVSSFTTTPDAGYSIRVYCESSTGIGCQAMGTIANYK